MRKKNLVQTADEALSALDDKNSLDSVLINEINKSLGEVRAFALGEQEAPTDITTFVSTGSTILDTIMTNGKWPGKGGAPVRRLLSISANSSNGKSLLANTLLLNTQKMGGIPILFDEENSTDISLLVKMGLKVGDEAKKAGLHKLVYASAGSVEALFDSMELTIKKIRETGCKDFITIVWDSIAATPSKVELEGGYEQEGYGMQKAKAISLASRKFTQFIGRENVLFVFINQLRSGPTGFGSFEKFSEPGGMTVPFHSTIRLRLVKIENITISSQKEPIGVKIQAEIKKNKIAPPMRKCTFNVYFDKGIDDEASWFDNLVEKGIISRPTKMSYELELPDFSDNSVLKPVKFKSSEWKSIISDKRTREWVKNKVIQANIIDYSNLTPSFDEHIDQVKLTEELVDMEGD